MAYTLRKCRQSRGIYLKIYFSYRDPETKKPRNKYISSPGYVQDLQAKGIEDPIEYYEKEIQRMNDELRYSRESEKKPEIREQSCIRNLGYFPLKVILNKLDIRKDLELLAGCQDIQPDIFEILSMLVYSLAADPELHEANLDQRIKYIFDSRNNDISGSRILSCLEFLGSQYPKVIEIFTHQIREVYGLDTSLLLTGSIELERDRNKNNEGTGIALAVDRNFIPVSLRFCSSARSRTEETGELIQELEVWEGISSPVIRYLDGVDTGLEEDIFQNTVLTGTDIDLTQWNELKETMQKISDRISTHPRLHLSQNQANGCYLIGYITYLLERLFGLEVLDDQYSPGQIREFIEDFRIVPYPDGTWANLSERSGIIEDLARKYSLPILNQYLKESEIKKVLEL